MNVIPLSTVDELGKISRTIFVYGCNLSCPFCQNHEIIGRKEKIVEKAGLAIDGILGDSVIDCIVVSGGEPLAHDDIGEFLSRLKRSGKEIYLNTNGCFPDRLKQVDHLVNGVCMDVKSSFSRYAEAVGERSFNIEPVKKSMEWLIGRQRDGFKVEFRTTMGDPFATRTDVIEIAGYLHSRNFSGYYALQQLDMSNVKDSCAGKMKAFSTGDMITTAKQINGLSFKVFIRTLDRGIVKFF